ncbi:MAG TPA: hypothetical protein DEB40_11540, partial [Elusimicrobia bacterium]|nr:hypothetical protein [Elusimicrobiota bacterium]
LTPPQSGEGAQLLAMSLQDCGVGDVRLNVEARPGGGFRIWFDQGMALAEAYARQRGRETASY